MALFNRWGSGGLSCVCDGCHRSISFGIKAVGCAPEDAASPLSAAPPARWSRRRPEALLLWRLDGNRKQGKGKQWNILNQNQHSNPSYISVRSPTNQKWWKTTAVMLIGHDRREIPKRFPLIGCRFIWLFFPTISEPEVIPPTTTTIIPPSPASSSLDYLLLSSFIEELCIL